MNFYIYIILVIAFIVLCLYGAYNYYQQYQKKQEEAQYMENKEFLKKATSIHTEFYFFHTKWCPHCKTAMEVWNNIKESSRFGEYKIHFIDIDCEDKKNKALVHSHEIKEYPSYVLVAKGKKYIYDANLSEDTLERFIQAVYKNI